MAVTWSFCVVDGDGTAVDEADADRLHSTASIGKVFLLCEAAELIVAGRLDPARPLLREPALAVSDSGLWQHLDTELLPLPDLAAEEVRAEVRKLFGEPTVDVEVAQPHGSGDVGLGRLP